MTRVSSNVARVFPPWIVERLQAAARTPASAVNPLARIKAIEVAIEDARHACPDLFRSPTSSHDEDGGSQ